MSSSEAAPAAASSFAGRYLSVFSAAFAALVLLLLILEQLGVAGRSLTGVLFAGPVAVFLLTGVLTATGDSVGFFAADRAAPTAVGAVSKLAGITGSVGFVVLPGAYFFLGFDALPFTLGILLGLVVSTVLVVPYARKDGAFTLAGYVGRRFESRSLRLMTAMALTLPALMILVAELKAGSFLLAGMLRMSQPTVVWALCGLALASTVAGGVRALTWSGAAQGLTALIGLLVPATLAAALLTTIPLPQITYGMITGDLARLEAASGIDTNPAAAMVLTVPGGAPSALVKPFLQPFVASDHMSFILLTLTIAIGMASTPALFARAGTAPSVPMARRSMLWLLCLVGLLALTLPAVAVLTRLELLRTLPAVPVDQVPAWLDLLARSGFADYDSQSSSLLLRNVHFTRDSVSVLLPLALGLPKPLVDIVLLGGLAACLAAVSSQIVTLASLWTEDAIFAWMPIDSQETARLLCVRGLLALAAALGGWLALTVHADPLTLFVWALALSGSSVFALLVMSVWWKRINQWGAMAGLILGYLAALAQILVSLNGTMPLLFGISGALASIFAVPLSAAVAFAVSLMTPLPKVRITELVRDIRVPGGEAVYDREVRMSRVARRKAPEA